MTAKKVKKRKKSTTRKAARNPGKSSHKQSFHPPSESRPVETATIVWMLTCLIGLTAEVVTSILFFVEWAFGSQDSTGNEDSIVLLIAILALFVALFLSPINLILAGVLRRVRKAPPPRSILILALAIGLAPIPLVLLARTFI